MIAALVVPAVALGQFSVGTTNTFFHESGGPLNMTVLTPSASAKADFSEHVGINAGWEADIVSGASVAVVDAPASGMDAISSATKLDDVRHVFHGGLRLTGDLATVRAAYAYGFESDYRSHSISINARSELFERNTAFDITYARGFDEVCNLYQPDAQQAVEKQRLPSSDGCFSNPDRTSEDVSLQTFQGAWTQAWTPYLATQLTLTAQLLHGFQSNPYRAVWLGRVAAQEHHPEDRARYSAALSVRYWIAALSGAIQLSLRGYRDTWDVLSFTADLGYEQHLTEGLRLRVRGRWYAQSEAAFFSDDYARLPKGQYFTGDRELSAMQSVVVGAQATWLFSAGEEGDALGFLDSLQLVVKGDLVFNSFDEFHYGRASVPNTNALIATVGLDAVF